MTKVENTNDVTINGLPLMLRAFFLIAFGISLFLVNSDNTVNLVLLILLAMPAGIMGLVFVQKNKLGSIPKNWLIIESVADIVLGLTLLYMYISDKNGISQLRDVFSGFAILFAFMQFTYLFQVALTDFNENIKVLLIKGLTAIGFGLFGVVLFFQTDSNIMTFLINCIGIGPILAGVGCISLIMYSFRRQSRL